MFVRLLRSSGLFSGVNLARGLSKADSGVVVKGSGVNIGLNAKNLGWGMKDDDDEEDEDGKVVGSGSGRSGKGKYEEDGDGDYMDEDHLAQI